MVIKFKWSKYLKNFDTLPSVLIIPGKTVDKLHSMGRPLYNSTHWEDHHITTSPGMTTDLLHFLGKPP